MSIGAPQYRADIDGLRALAIAAVLVYHVNPSWLGGGFVGVDVFFVISGFLITSIIYRDLSGGRFSLAGFYERRIRRIVPALSFMFAVVLAVGWFKLLPLDFVAFAKSLISGVLSVSNVHFLWGKTGYFTQTVSEIPLLHTWSLGVEEQFYLVFPLLLLLLHRFTKSSRVMFVVVLGVALLSLAASIYYVSHKPQKAFYLLPFRAWEMAAGSLLALAGTRSMHPRTGNFLGLLGLIFVLGSMFVYDDATPFPGLAAMIPCAGAVLMILAGRNPQTWVAKMLSWKPLVGLGLISYSVYLWHWPVISLAKYSSFEKAPNGIYLLLASLILGALSWRFIEQPFRKPGFLSRKGTFVFWGATSVALIAVALFISHGEGLPFRMSPEARRYLEYQKSPLSEVDKKDRFNLMGLPPAGDLTVTPSIAIWGDSHAEILLPMLDKQAKERKKGIRRFGVAGVAPVIGVGRRGQHDSEKNLDYSERVLAYLCSEPSIKTVILHARWGLYANGWNEDPQDALPELVGHDFPSRRALQDFYASQITLTVRKLLDAGKQVLLVYPVPEIGRNVPAYLAKHSVAKRNVPEAIPLADFHPRVDFLIAAMDSISAPGDQLLRVRPHEKLMKGDQVMIMKDNQPLYHDDDHLSGPGIELVRELFEPAFDKF